MYFVKQPIHKKELAKLLTLKHEFMRHKSDKIKHQHVRMYVWSICDGLEAAKMNFR